MWLRLAKQQKLRDPCVHIFKDTCLHEHIKVFHSSGGAMLRVSTMRQQSKVMVFKGSNFKCDHANHLIVTFVVLLFYLCTDANLKSARIYNSFWVHNNKCTFVNIHAHTHTCFFIFLSSYYSFLNLIDSIYVQCMNTGAITNLHFVVQPSVLSV